jgi:carbon storage regulator CsrA
MLVLTREPLQTLMIGHDVTVTILEVNGDQVRLRVNTPAGVVVQCPTLFSGKEAGHRPRRRR